MTRVPTAKPESVPEVQDETIIVVSELEVERTSDDSALIVEVGYDDTELGFDDPPKKITEKMYLLLSPPAAARLARALEEKVQQHLYGDEA